MQKKGCPDPNSEFQLITGSEYPFLRECNCLRDRRRSKCKQSIRSVGRDSDMSGLGSGQFFFPFVIFFFLAFGYEGARNEKAFRRKMEIPLLCFHSSVLPRSSFWRLSPYGTRPALFKRPRAGALFPPLDTSNATLQLRN